MYKCVKYNCVAQLVHIYVGGDEISTLFPHASSVISSARLIYRMSVAINQRPLTASKGDVSRADVA